uniref:Odorant receptor n=1 Tax=Aphidius gifuensis TaxID=684658 RepID=A0A3S5HSS2_APHGI|nr:odorant receptor [Aphidius gifuensis]
MRLGRSDRSYTKSWNSNTKQALGLYRLLAKNLGFWPMDCHTTKSKFLITFVIITQLWMSMSLIVLLLIKGNCGAITEFVDALSLIICGLTSVIKVVIPRINYKKMSAIIQSAVNDWQKIDHHDKSHFKTMQYFSNIGRVVFIIQMSGAYIVGFPLIVMKLPFVVNYFHLNKDESLLLINKTILTTSSNVGQVPIGPTCWIPTNMSPSIYFLYFISQSIQLFIVCSAYIGSDTYFFGIGLHIWGQLRILNNSLDKFNKADTVSKEKILLRKFIKRHDHLLKLIKYFEDIYSYIILAQVGTDVLLTCISGIVLLMTVQYGDPIVIGGLVIRIYLVYVQLFMYCFIGEKLTEESNKLEISIYHDIPWYNMDKKIVNNIKFIMMRINYSYKLTAGKMYTMNYANFIGIIKAMGSYFSILRLMFINNNE